MNGQVLLSSFLLLVSGLVVAQNNNELDQIEKQLKDNIPGLEGFNSSKLPTEEDLERVLKEKCDKNGGGDEAFQALKNQQTEIQSCLQSQLNATEIQAEIEEKKKTGSMDEVFAKYCKKYPEIYKCVETVTDKVKLCLDPAEQEALNKSLSILHETKDFLCFKDGDRLAMFIAEGGVECLEERKEALQECANKTIGARIPTDFSVNSLPLLVFTQKECTDFDKVRQCFNEELEKCKNSTPANIIDAFFKFLKKHMPCGETPAVAVQQKETEAAPGGSTALAASVLLVLSVLSINL